MSNRAVVISLVLVVVLAAAAAIVLRQPTAVDREAEPVALLSVPIATVRGLELRAGDRRESVRLGESGWMHEVAGDVGGDGGALERWPIERDQVTAALRLLATRTLTPTGETIDAEPAGVLVLTSEEGPIATLAFWPERVGGRMPMRLERPGAESITGWAEGDLGELFVGTGFGPWRARAAVPMGLENPERVRLVGAGGAIELVRDGLRWRLVEPFAAAADGQAVRAVVGQLGRVRIERFDPEGAAGALGSPWLTVEIDHRGGDGLLRTELALGESLDLAGRVHGARATVGPIGGEQDLIPRRELAVLAEDLQGLAIEPTSLVRRTAIGEPMGEVLRVATLLPGMDAARFERTIGGWRRDGGRPIQGASVEALEAVLEWACVTPADRVIRSSDQAEGRAGGVAGESIGAIGLVVRGGETIQIELRAETGGGAITAQAGDGLVRAYAGPARDELLRAIALLGGG